MNQSLLVCIAYHHVPERLKWLKKVVGNLLVSYQVPLTIIIDTNTMDINSIRDVIGMHSNVSIYSHPNLEHPFYLTRMHRQHFKNRIEEFDVFYYNEDDQILPFENYIAALEKYDQMWAFGCVPTFIRIEEANDKQYASDIIRHKSVDQLSHHWIGGREFVALGFPENYNGFWMMPQKYLKDNMLPDFTKMSDGREWAAMYPTWELNKQGLVEVYKKDGKYYLHENNYSFHLPNNYIGSSMGNATIEVQNIFI